MKLNQIQTQADELWQTLVEPDTATIYSQAFTKTWDLLKKAARLIVLVTLMVVAFLLLVWGFSFQKGRQLREWLETERPSPATVVDKVVETTRSPLEQFSEWAKAQIKEQLGKEIK